MNLYSRNTGISITFLLPKKRATKTGNIAAKRVEKRKCAFLPPINQTCLGTNQVVASCVKTDFNWNYAGSSQVIRWSDVTYCKTSLLWAGKTSNMYRFCRNNLNYSLLSATTFRNLQQPDSCTLKHATSLFNTLCRNAAENNMNFFEARFTVPLVSAMLSCLLFRLYKSNG